MCVCICDVCFPSIIKYYYSNAICMHKKRLETDATNTVEQSYYYPFTVPGIVLCIQRS